MTTKCTRKGCEKKYDPEQNLKGRWEGDEGPCLHHPGAPIFHEGLKGWHCCKKRVLGFDEFMKIPGCTYGLHSDEQFAPLVPVSTSGGVNKDVKLSTDSNGVEVYTTPSVMTPISPPPPRPVKEKESPPQDDPIDAKIDMGVACKRRGCSQLFQGDKSRTETCVYHPGAPMFHEGSKGWTCCSRRVLEFEEFLRIEGCEVGKHKFLDNKKPESGEKKVECRHDWYQDPQKVMLSIYAKKLNKSLSTIEFEDYKVKAFLKFEDGGEYSREFFLAGAIVVPKSKYEILSTKVDICLPKANLIAWSSLEVH